MQVSWEQTRTVVYFNYLLTETKGKKKSATEIMPLHWDVSEVKKRKTSKTKPKSQKELERLYNNINNKKNG